MCLKVNMMNWIIIIIRIIIMLVQKWKCVRKCTPLRSIMRSSRGSAGKSPPNGPLHGHPQTQKAELIGLRFLQTPHSQDVGLDEEEDDDDDDDDDTGGR